MVVGPTRIDVVVGVGWQQNVQPVLIEIGGGVGDGLISQFAGRRCHVPVGSGSEHSVEVALNETVAGPAMSSQSLQHVLLSCGVLGGAVSVKECSKNRCDQQLFLRSACLATIQVPNAMNPTKRKAKALKVNALADIKNKQRQKKKKKIIKKIVSISSSDSEEDEDEDEVFIVEDPSLAINAATAASENEHDEHDDVDVVVVGKRGKNPMIVRLDPIIF